MMREAKMSGHDSINETTVYDYASVGCLENTMVGNDRSGTVDNNLNLLKAVELALTGGKDLLPHVDFLLSKVEKTWRNGPDTGDATHFESWDEFWRAYVEQTKYIVQKCVEVYEKSEEVRARFCPTPYLSCLVRGCAEKGLDITQGGSELIFTTIEGVTFATTVDSLLATKYLVFDKKECTIAELIRALKDNWEGHEVLQAKAKNKAPKYGRDDDKRTRRHARLWISGRRRRGSIRPDRPNASSDRGCSVGTTGWATGILWRQAPTEDRKGEFFPTQFARPTAPTSTVRFNPSLLRDPEHKKKFKAFLRGYIENGGTALQINILDADMLRDAQKHPEEYRNLLVRVTGYNAYFTSIGRELQDEIIACESHNTY